MNLNLVTSSFFMYKLLLIFLFCLKIMVGAKKELSSLWSWLCTLNTVTLKFISQFVVCTYQSENHMQSIGLCNREKSSLISFDEIPVIQRSSLTLYTLESVITCLPRPLYVNLVM